MDGNQTSKNDTIAGDAIVTKWLAVLQTARSMVHPIAREDR